MKKTMKNSKSNFIGLPPFDIQGGLLDQKVYLIYGYPYVGKTALALYMANNLIRQNRIVIYWDTYYKLTVDKVSAAIEEPDKLIVIRPVTRMSKLLKKIMQIIEKNNSVVIFDSYFGLSNIKTLHNELTANRSLNSPPMVLLGEARSKMDATKDIEPYFYKYLANFVHYFFKMTKLKTLASYRKDQMESIISRIVCTDTISDLYKGLIVDMRINNGVIDERNTLINGLIRSRILRTFNQKLYYNDQEVIPREIDFKWYLQVIENSKKLLIKRIENEDIYPSLQE